MRETNKRQRMFHAGFTLTELLVLVAVGSLLSGLLVADLSQTRSKLLQQACAANLKQWGMAFNLYAQDYNGVLFNNWNAIPWDDTIGSTPSGGTATNVYLRYLGGGNSLAAVRAIRICPFVAATVTNALSVVNQPHSYTMCSPTALKNGAYQTIVPDANNFLGIDLKKVPYPSQFLLLMDGGSSENVGCGKLLLIATRIPKNDSIGAIDRHGGSVNCLFGDFHVELVSSNRLAQQDSVSCGNGNPWFMMN